jgi:hypothetical protein
MKVEISDGELVDKLTILEIKLSKVSSYAADKKYFIKNEHDILKPLVNELGIDEELVQSLRLVNCLLWETEDKIRKKEESQDFDEEFIHLARSVYKNNDRRFQIKKEINALTSSNVQEQKLYGHM